MKLTPFTETDFQGLYDFMKPLWLETYSPILPEKQILFLLDKYFSEEGLKYYRGLGYQYFKIDDIGVLVYVIRDEDVFMVKLYLLPSARGKGYAAFAFDEMSKHGKPVTLSVNQANERAKKCYAKNGFVQIDAVAVDLGNGMVNYDYILQRKKK